MKKLVYYQTGGKKQKIIPSSTTQSYNKVIPAACLWMKMDTEKTEIYSTNICTNLSLICRVLCFKPTSTEEAFSFTGKWSRGWYFSRNSLNNYLRSRKHASSKIFTKILASSFQAVWHNDWCLHNHHSCLSLLTEPLILSLGSGWESVVSGQVGLFPDSLTARGGYVIC